MNCRILILCLFVTIRAIDKVIKLWRVDLSWKCSFLPSESSFCFIAHHGRPSPHSAGHQYSTPASNRKGSRCGVRRHVPSRTSACHATSHPRSSTRFVGRRTRGRLADQVLADIFRRVRTILVCIMLVCTVLRLVFFTLNRIQSYQGAIVERQARF